MLMTSESPLDRSGRAQAPPTAAVWASGLTHAYGRVAALRDVDLAVPPGTVCALVGPNGAGKTTLLRILATLVQPDAGTVCVAGCDVLADPRAARRSIGLVAHQPLLYPDLSVEENLHFYARLYGVALGTDLLGQALAAVDLVDFRRVPVHDLSRGMVQRLAIARARLHEPAVLLLDEPHAGLDPTAADALDEALADLTHRGQTVLLATHDLGRAHALADQLVVLSRGRVTWCAPRDEVVLAEFKAAYRAATARPADDGRPARAPVVSSVGPAVDKLESPATGALSSSAQRPARPQPAPVRASFATAVRAVVWKDLVVELRTRDVVPPMVVFALLVITLFALTLPVAPGVQMLVTPSALWIALVFGSTLGLARALGSEVDSGGFIGLLLSPADRGALFTAKWLAGLVFSVLVAGFLLPLFVVWLGLPVQGLWNLAVVLLLGLAGWVAAGTLMAAMAASTRAREVLLPVLLYPLVLPLLIPAVHASARAIEGQPLTGLAAPLLLMAAYDLIFFVLGFLLFPYVVEG